MNWKQRWHNKVAFGTSEQCWEWQCTKDKDGYGVLTVDGKKKKAHRISMEIEGHDLTGLLVIHRCDNPACVNPEHLGLGTQKDNMLDMAQKGRGANKISNDQVLEIRDKYASGDYVLADLALEYGVTFQHISALVHRIKRKAV